MRKHFYENLFIMVFNEVCALQLLSTHHLDSFTYIKYVPKTLTQFSTSFQDVFLAFQVFFKT